MIRKFIAVCFVLAIFSQYLPICLLNAQQLDIEEIQTAIQENNAEWQAEENHITRLKPEERKLLLGSFTPDRHLAKQMFIDLPRLENVPDNLDWRNNAGNWVTPVKNQGQCGSCWAFAAVAQVESWYKIANQYIPHLDLSEQYILSCSGAGTCDGGWTEGALTFIQQTGVPPESYLVYQASDDVECSETEEGWEDEAVLIPGWGYITLAEANIESIKQALMRQPVAATYTVYSDFFSYQGGVYENVWGEDEGGHAILIVGWDDSERSWICKNSWGQNWGDDGYFRIRWGSSGMGDYVTFIYDEITGNQLFTSITEIEVDLIKEESSQIPITLENRGQGTVSFSLMDFEIPLMWHSSSFRAYEGQSLWCGDPAINGYDDRWLQYLDIPAVDLSDAADPKLHFVAQWGIEEPGGEPEGWDGWDGWNVWISMDNGETFEVIDPVAPGYTSSNLWSFGHHEQGWDMGFGISGWTGLSNGWKDAVFDLSMYKSAETIIRFAFASDLAMCGRDDRDLFGVIIDNIQIKDGNTVLFENDGESISDFTRSGKGSKPSEWMSLDMHVGEIRSNEYATVLLHIETGEMLPGEYLGGITIASNDSVRPSYTIPVLLRIHEFDYPEIIPDQWQLLPVYPNPFNEGTTIVYNVPYADRVNVSIFDNLGRHVNTLVNGDNIKGISRIFWDGRDKNGRQAPTGVYIFRLQTGNTVLTKKGLLIK